MKRRQVLASLLGGGCVAGVSLTPAFQRAIIAQDESNPSQDAITAEQVDKASWIVDAKLTPEQCEEVAKELTTRLRNLKPLRENPPLEDVPMPLAFVPSFFVASQNNNQIVRSEATDWKQSVELPEFKDISSIVEWSIPQIALALRKGLFSCEQATRFYLDRLEAANDKLLCVVTFNEKALDAATRMDEELKQGKDRGVLHGIPWGAKDIIAVPGMPTTWGVGNYETREWQTPATVYDKLEMAGAVLLAKLSVGTMAMGDEWFRGTTKNPWNIKQGSSGSSAGSASAVAARLCPFALGSETLGSIVSPTRVCATSGLRPTFGRVSRAGCMTLAWSMDKIGPIANRVEDLAIVFQELLGSDQRDPTVVDRPFAWPTSLAPKDLKIGITERLSRSERFVADWLQRQGAELVTIKFEKGATTAMLDALSAEAASVHDKLFRSVSQDSELGKWGPTYREAQWVRAIDYLHGMRQRVDLIQDAEQQLAQVDLLVGDGNLARMNLTGHPSLVVAFGVEPQRRPAEGDAEKPADSPPPEFDMGGRRRPNTVVLTGKMFSESTLLVVGQLIQSAHPFEMNS
jgi:Asp-tRNA(Asn)/Glu-tRNA(Gln) amidotransferase A subunit family amidase